MNVGDARHANLDGRNDDKNAKNVGKKKMMLYVRVCCIKLQSACELYDKVYIYMWKLFRNLVKLKFEMPLQHFTTG